MDPLYRALDLLVPLALGGTTILYLRDFLRGTPRGYPWSRVALQLTILLQIIRFVAFVSVWQRLPLASPGEAFTTIALAITIVYALLEAWSRERSAGFFFLTIATVFKVCGVLGAPPGTEVNQVLRQTWFGIHAITAVLGYTAFAVSAVYAILFLMLYRDLKHRRFGLWYDRMPPLDRLSSTSTLAATLGLGFLTVAIAVGAFGWSKVLDYPAHQDPKVVSSLIVWTVYATGLVLHRFARWSGIRSIGLTLIAFGLMVLSSWLMPLVLHSVHDVRELL
jgi:ABC-type uncharacterized transport system permease subunit